MKTKHLLTSITLCIILGLFILVPFNQNYEKNYFPRNEINSVNNYSAHDAMNWQNERRANQHTGIIDIKDVEKAKKQVAALRMNKGTSTLDLNWIELGPDNVGGRTRALLIDRNNSQVMYAGGVAGGLWKTTTGGLSWQLIGDQYENNAIVSICQASNGDIYFGTGESFAASAGTDLNTGTRGMGIWKSASGTDNFVHLSSTWSNTDTDIQNTFIYVSKLAADPSNSNRIYAATNKGLRVTDDGGTIWYNPLTSSQLSYQDQSTDVKVASDGTVIASISELGYISSTGDNGSFVMVSGSANNPDVIPNTQMARLEFAFAPSNLNYIYCLASWGDGSLRNVYRSTNKGDTWAPIFEGIDESMNVFGDNNQGNWNNTIAVYPNDPTKIIVGGIDLWKWKDGEIMEPISYWQEWAGQWWVHADQHAIVFHPDYNGTTNKTIFFANDGGVFRSMDAGSTFTPLVKRYTTTQFYTVGFSGDGRVVGGTQDNGTQYIDYMGNTVKSAVEVLGGDGGGCAMSMLHPDVIFATIYYGRLSRSGNRENDMEPFTQFAYSPWMYSELYNQHIGTDYEPFIPQIALWESFYDTKSIDSIEFINWGTEYLADNEEDSLFVDSLYNALNLIYNDVVLVDIDEDHMGIYINYQTGEAIYGSNGLNRLRSNIYNRPITHIFEGQCNLGDTIQIHDYYQAALALGLNGNVWITRYPLNFAKDWIGENYWYPAIDTSVLSNKNIGAITALAWSKNGNHLFVADRNYPNNRIYRISNFQNARTCDDIMTYNHESPEYNMLVSPDSMLVTETQVIGTFSQTITDIAIDPTNPNNIVVTLGNYGNTEYVYFSTNAATTNSENTNVNFISIQGNLPEMPVYTAVVNWNDSREIIIGTEYGMYATDDVTDTTVIWTDQNNNIPNIPVYQIRQQTFSNFWASGNTGVSNHGIIYAGTHGRGFFKCKTLEGPTAIEEIPVSTAVNIESLILYPNPVSERATVSYNLNKSSNVEIKIYNLNGKLIKYQMLTNQIKGSHKYSFDTTKLEPGTYIFNLNSGGKQKSTKFIVY